MPSLGHTVTTRPSGSFHRRRCARRPRQLFGLPHVSVCRSYRTSVHCANAITLPTGRMCFGFAGVCSFALIFSRRSALSSPPESVAGRQAPKPLRLGLPYQSLVVGMNYLWRVAHLQRQLADVVERGQGISRVGVPHYVVRPGTIPASLRQFSHRVLNSWSPMSTTGPRRFAYGVR